MSPWGSKGATSCGRQESPVVHVYKIQQILLYMQISPSGECYGGRFKRVQPSGNSAFQISVSLACSSGDG